MAPPKNNDTYLELVKDNSTGEIKSPRVLQRIEEDVLDACRQLIEHMFSASDDLFYELSKRASTNNEENLYFESMREMRLKKEGLASSFGQRLHANFTQLLNPNDVVQQDVDDEDINLSIVEGDELEIDIALKSMSSRTQEAFKTELYEICIRLDHLLLQITVTEKNNPIDPLQISRAFVEACVEKLNIGIKTRLIIFKLFEKHVLKQLGHIYADVNKTLVDTGILPKVPKNLSKHASAGHPQDFPEHEEFETEKPDDRPPGEAQISITQNTLATLMEAIRTSQGTVYRREGQSGQNHYYFYANNPGPVMPLPDLARGLTNRQPIVEQNLINSTPRNVLPELITELLSKKDPNVPQSLEQPDEDTINLVAMFFDKILEDEDLPIPVQSLICRLQIPILKVALNDKNFLSEPEHPARKLINTITQVGVSFDESKHLDKDPIYKKIVDAVLTVNKQYKLDDVVFRQVNDELEKLVQKERKKSTVVEQRTNQTEEGKAKVKSAKSFAQNALYEKMKDANLPAKVSEFLTNTWLQVLVITYLKDGKEGSDWVENEQLISDLIWLSQPHQDDRSIARAQRLKPSILSRIEKGLEAAIDNAESRSAIIDGIDEVIGVVDNLDTDIEEIELRGLTQDQKDSLGKSEDAEKTWEEMTALERQQSRYEELSNKFYQEAKNVPIGTWIEYHDNQNGRIVRCKLSAKIDAETYIFVTRLGFKAMEKTRRQFAYDMQFNKAKILDSTPLFDRVMGGIINHFSEPKK